MFARIETIFRQCASACYRRCFLTLAVVALLTLALASQILHLTMDMRDESFFHESDPALVEYNRFRDTFGQDSIFIVAMIPRDGITRGFLQTLTRIHRELSEETPFLDDITSLYNGRIMRADADTLHVGELMEEPVATDQDLERVLDLIEHYPMFENLLVSGDRKMVSIILRAKAVIPASGGDVLSDFDDSIDAPEVTTEKGAVYLSNDENIMIYDAILGVTERFRDEGIDFHYGGVPVIISELTRGIEKDIIRMMPLSLCIIIILLFFLFRRFSGVVYPVIVVVLSLASSFGIMGLSGIPITMVIQILPTFLLVVGIGDSVHILAIFYRNISGGMNRYDAIVAAVGYSGLPVMMTSLTTAFGLFSFTFADMKAVAQLGYVAPVGVMMAFFYTIVLLPALVAIFPLKKVSDNKTGNVVPGDRIFDAIARVTTHHPVRVVVVSALVVSVAGYFSLSLRLSHNELTWFPETMPMRVSTELIDATNGGSVMLEATIDTGMENGLYDPGLINRLDDAVTAIKTLDVGGIIAGKAWSLADVLKEINRALHRDRDDAYTLPDTERAIAQELLLFESSGSDDLDDFTDAAYRTARLSIMVPFDDAVIYREYLDRVREYLDRSFPDEAVTLTGNMALFVRIIEHFITSMAKSYGFALVMITCLMILMIGKVRIGLMSMIANVVPLVMIFGVMGIMAIPVDMATILVGGIVLGLIVDDTIHFLHHFRRAFAETGDVEAAVRVTLHTTGRALVITSMVLCAGFFIYTLSFLLSNVRFGLLVGWAILFALAADFFLVPALLTLVYRRHRRV